MANMKLDKKLENQTNRVKSHYNEIAEKWEKRYQDPIRNEYFVAFEDKFIFNLINFKGKKVLDLGTGTGRYPFKLAKIAKYIEGIDISEKEIEIAKKNNRNLNVAFKAMDAKNLSYNPESFDVVLAIGMFEYVNCLNPYFKEINRVLKNNGSFIFTCHNKDAFSKSLPKKHFPRTSHCLPKLINSLSSNGFQIISYVTTFFITFPQKAFIFSEFIPLFIRKFVLAISIKINDFFSKNRFTKNKGKEIIILVKKIKLINQ